MRSQSTFERGAFQYASNQYHRSWGLNDALNAPVITLRNIATGQTVQTTDPGRSIPPFQTGARRRKASRS
jgi:hypothetical protein